MHQADDAIEEDGLQQRDRQDQRVDPEKGGPALRQHLAQVQFLVQVRDKVGPVEMEEKSDKQSTGLNAQSDEDEPGDDVQCLEYEVVCLCHAVNRLTLIRQI